MSRHAGAGLEVHRCHSSVRYSVTQDRNGLWYAVLHEDGRDFAYLEEMHAHERDAACAATAWLRSLRCWSGAARWPRRPSHTSQEAKRLLRGAVIALDERGLRILVELLA